MQFFYLMSACVAYGCFNRPSKKVPGITFHRFPSVTERRIAWINAVRRENWTPSKWSSLCSEHFTEDQIDRTSLCCVRLRENAVPNVFKILRPCHKNGRKKLARSRKLMEQSDLKERTENEESKKDTEKATSSAAPLTLNPIVIYVKDCIKSEDKSPTSPTVSVPTSSICTLPKVATVTVPAIITNGAVSVSKRTVPSDSNVKESPLELQRKLQLAIDRIIFLNKKLKVSQQKCRRLTKKVKSLKPTLRILKQENQMTTEDLRTVFYDTPLELLREL